MSELNDCFTASGTRMTVGEAVDQFSNGLTTVTGLEECELRASRGRVLAEDVVADRLIPPHNNAAVDGFAVYFDDLNSEAATTLPIAGRVAAGHPLNGVAERGNAYQIFTGAAVPVGPDTIYMLEDCVVDSDHVTVKPGIRRGDNLRLAGEDVGVGDVVLRVGIRLRPQDVAMAASLGRTTLPVRKRLRVGVFSTGDEIIDPGDQIKDGCIFDINRYSVISMLDALGCEVDDLGILPDDLAVVRNALGEWKGDHDLILTSGGVSMGEEDHVKTAVSDQGSINFWNLAMKPGRPIALGCLGTGADERPFIGLPGNPVAAMVTFMAVARPVILLLSGAVNIEPTHFRVVASFDFKKKPGRREWLRATLRRANTGEVEAVKFPAEGSGILTSMVTADGLVVLSEECESVRAGELVDFLPFSEVMR